jgi:hypothetical protein
MKRRISAAVTAMLVNVVWSAGLTSMATRWPLALKTGSPALPVAPVERKRITLARCAVPAGEVQAWLRRAVLMRPSDIDQISP